MSPIDNMSETVKMNAYEKKRASEYVGKNRRFPSMSQLITKAVNDLCDKLEASKN